VREHINAVEILEHFRGEIIIRNYYYLGGHLISELLPALQPTRDEMMLEQFDANEFKAELAEEVMQSALMYASSEDMLQQREALEENEMETRHASIKHSHTGTQMLFLIH